MVRVRAPELPAAFTWLNTDHPLSLKALRGRVVLLDFWTYGCINCLHILPDLKALEQKYRDRLTLIGVHSAKFDHEQNADSIRHAIQRYEITHPVLVDCNFEVWQQYTIRAWPTVVVIDPQGYVVATLMGEGQVQGLEEWITRLIGDQPSMTPPVALPEPLLTPLAFPGKVLADAASNRLVIADSGHHRLVITSLTGNNPQVIGTGTAGFKDGSFTEAEFAAPQGIALDAANQLLYVADTHNHAIRRLDLQQQTVTTIAGTGQQSRRIQLHSGLALATALNSPWDIALVGPQILIAMAGAHQIWRLDLQTGSVGTYAGTGAEACVDGEVHQAVFAQPSGITWVDQEAIVADSESSSIRAMTLGSPAIVRTLCGGGDLFSFGDQDGQGEAVRLQHCLGVATDGHRQVWIADTYNHKIKRLDLDTQICITILGDGRAAHRDGQGIQASFSEPSGLSQASNQLYIADTNNHAIRRVDLETLTVSTLAFPGLCAPNLCLRVESSTPAPL
ncbi:MAG: redoxin domain-containing protein [Synechococcales cyanobacterium M58_A2018_015]|nr:redoxin domain-containing protein [Synechococcales cyanobacterium M58_A2018_015]